MIKNILGVDFKYEDHKLYRKLKSKWNCCNDIKGHSRGYIQIGINNKLYYLHRVIYKYFNEGWDITDSSSNNLIDHIDINPSNNRIENLRRINNSQNLKNRNKFKNCSSKFKGVSWNKQNNKWKAHISINGKLKHLGYFTNEEEAGEAYKKIYNEIIKF